MAEVTVTESRDIVGKRVGERILKCKEDVLPDLALADETFLRACVPHETTAYLFFAGPTIRKGRLFTWRVRRPVIGKLSIDQRNDARWLMQVYSRDYLEPLRKLADVLVTEYDKDIHIRLEREAPDRYENF